MRTGDEEARLVLVEPSGRGGLAHFTFGLANALAARGYQVSVMTSVTYEMADRRRRFHLHQVFDRTRTNPIRVWQTLREIRPRVVHLHGAAHPELYLPFLLAVRRLRVTTVYSVHDIQPRQWAWFPRGVLRLLWAVPDQLIAHSAYVARSLGDEFGIPAERIAIVPHGEYQFLAEAMSRPGELGKDAVLWPEAMEPRVLFFGYILPQKGLTDLLEAFRRVADAIPAARLSIVGQPVGDFGPYRAQIRSLGLEDRVEVHLGYVPIEAMGPFFRAAMVVALPYRFASQSGVLFAAYAFARPVVATRCGGLLEYVKPGCTGLMVPVADPPALAEALIELLRDAERCRRLGETARAWSQTEFCWDRIAALTSHIYENSFREPG